MAPPQLSGQVVQGVGGWSYGGSTLLVSVTASSEAPGAWNGYPLQGLSSADGLVTHTKRRVEPPKKPVEPAWIHRAFRNDGFRHGIAAVEVPETRRML